LWRPLELHLAQKLTRHTNDHKEKNHSSIKESTALKPSFYGTPNLKGFCLKEIFNKSFRAMATP
jgi:hypothetical protein